MDTLKLNSEIIMEKEFDIDIKGYSAKQVDMFLDIVYEDYLVFDSVVNQYQEKINELIELNDKLHQNLRDIEKNQVVSNEVVPTEQINTLDILKRLSKLEQEVYNQK